MNLQIPTVGRIVHYFPAVPTIMTFAGADKFPAMVVHSDDEGRTILSVFTAVAHEPVVAQADILHKSKAEEGFPYWDWPPQIPQVNPKPPEGSTFPVDKKQPGEKS